MKKQTVWNLKVKKKKTNNTVDKKRKMKLYSKDWECRSSLSTLWSNIKCFNFDKKKIEDLISAIY